MSKFNLGKDNSGWWDEAIGYEVYLRSFADSNADGIGDLQGLVSKLDYLAWLGVDLVWVSPFYPSPMADFGYDVSDYCDVDPMFGTLEDKESGALIGRAGLNNPEREDWPGVEVGWALHPDKWGLGYATEAGAESIRYAFEDLDEDCL
ncbi:MAG: GNAT family N-acetyltransferase, partial [Actinomycetota bacterium]|nr:GNAT family N-acetyltransferase [Actinomycetota bacterium]